MVSEQTPPAPGNFGVGSHVAGYRLDEQIGRGGMAVVYRAYDARLERRVALKILAPELARDEEFRQRFIRESRAAAAVDHHNIIPIYEAGEAGGVLFIAMRFVDGRDVQTLIDRQGPLPPPRVIDIVAQVASALDAAHTHGLVHRDVKPANMLREPTSGSERSDHVYLSDFGLSKHSLSQSGLTSQGQFLGTLNYVAPEQIEGRPVDGRTDEYALACSAFEMLGGSPPFRRDETLAIMYAQLSTEPPSLTSLRPELPSAVDQVMARALAKTPGDRYATCLDFAAALRRACGLGPGATQPGAAPSGAGQPGRRGTQAVRPAELAAAAAAASSPAQPTPQPTGQDAGPPTQAVRIPSAGPTKAGLTDPLGPVAEGYYAPTGPPPRKGSRRTPAIFAVIAVVLLAAGGGAYLLLGKGGGHGDAKTTAATLTLAGCTTQTAAAAPLRDVHPKFVHVGGKPFDVVTTRNGFGFVSLRKGSPLVVMNTTKSVPSVIQTVAMPDNEGEAFTHDQQYLLVAGGSGLTVFRVHDLESGLTTPLGSLTSPGGKFALQVVPSPDDRFAFVALQNSGTVAVFNLRKALTAGFGPADFVGMIPVASDPTGMTATPDGRYLYVVSGLANTAVQSGMGKLAIVDMRKAEAHPASSVVREVDAGCGPARVITSADGKTVWVTAGGGNALEGFDAGKLLSGSRHALIAKVAVGEIPLGLTLINNGTRIVIANSNRDTVAGAVPGLAVVDVSKALAGKPALLGVAKSGLAPRQFALSPNGKTLLVTNTGSGQVEAVKVAQLP
jgi:DNA-binding beta-propeller fold protein YncE/tRNA A-37 threonylcarbamoyl transferase component Bud32